MWRIFLSLLAVQIIFTSDSNAQLLVGPVAGGEVAKAFFFDSQFRYKSLPTFGYEGGVMASMRVRKNFVLNAQLLYSHRSKHVVGVDNSRSDKLFDLTSSMQYIELPIFYVLEFKSLTGNPEGRGGRVKTYNWFIGGGPIISYWLSNKGRLSSSPLKEVYIDHIDYTTVFGRDNNSFNAASDFNKESISQPNRFQFGINITGGVAFEPVGFNKIVTSVHLNIAQTFLAKSDGVFPASIDDIDLMKVKNHSIRVTVAYLFDTKLETSKKGKSTKNKEVQRKRK